MAIGAFAQNGRCGCFVRRRGRRWGRIGGRLRSRGVGRHFRGGCAACGRLGRRGLAGAEQGQCRSGQQQAGAGKGRQWGQGVQGHGLHPTQNCRPRDCHGAQQGHVSGRRQGRGAELHHAPWPGRLAYPWALFTPHAERALRVCLLQSRRRALALPALAGSVPCRRKTRCGSRRIGPSRGLAIPEAPALCVFALHGIATHSPPCLVGVLLILV